MRDEKTFSLSGTAPVGSTAVIGEVVSSCYRHRTVAFEVTAGAQALDAFEVQVQMCGEGAWVTLINSFAAVGAILLFKSGDLAALAAGTAGQGLILLNGVFAIRFRASAATADSAVTIKGGLSE